MFKLIIEPEPNNIKIKPDTIIWGVDGGLYTPFSCILEIKDRWERFKKKIVKKEGKRCWICGEKDRYYGEPEDFWEYNDKNHIRTLVAIHYLCEKCSLIKHGWCSPSICRESIQIALKGPYYRSKELINHFCKINHYSIKQFRSHEKGAFKLWKKRCPQEWKSNFGKYSESIIKLLEAEKVEKIKFSIGTSLRNLPFTSFSVLCLRWRCVHLWRKFRNRVVKNLDYKCCYCGAKEKLHLHEPHKADNKKLTFKLLKPHLLCPDCHSMPKSYFGIVMDFGKSGELFGDRLKVNRVISRVKNSLKWKGLEVKKYKKQIQHLARQLTKKNWNKNYKKIEFDKVYNPLAEDILNHFNEKHIKVYYGDVKKFAYTLNFLKKVMNRKNFGCIITATESEFKHYPRFEIPYKIPLKVLKKKVSVSRISLKISPEVDNWKIKVAGLVENPK